MSEWPVILTDPPWSFEVYSKDTGQGRSAASHYPTMDMHELMALPVQSIAAPDCALLMWAVMPQLPEAFALGSAWGFKYKTCAFAWAKTGKAGFGWFMGMGFWTRANVELCLLFTRGRPQRKARNVRQLIVAPIREHSRKPDEQYIRIERLLDGPYVELFARHTRPNWTTLGNGIDGEDIRDSLAKMRNR